MQSKFVVGHVDKRAYSVHATNHIKKEPPKEEFSDWPNELLAIGTLGNKDLTNKHEIQAEQNDQDEQCSSPDFSEFTSEEAGKLQKELTKLLTRKSASIKAHDHEQIGDGHLPLDRFLNYPSSLEVDRTISDRFSTYSGDKDDDQDYTRKMQRCL
ncbi:hypothetical protein BUALT_Bualt02G0124700 [Buddleja alternifolia]|uniref:Uncharacterized protein n=1 Tax=Buddleja alternifolia TaxID=168488 RepID=A0AAV6Y6E4_9LAMI|nr:hypothetical protein BUALT_Bualt02G0124700 [Buddleja alternifolia]